MSRTALLVIDAQESFRHRPYFRTDGLDEYLHHQQALIDGAQQAGLPVLQVFHLDDTGPFAADSGLVRTLEPLRIRPDAGQYL